MSIEQSVIYAAKRKKEKKYDKIYILVDVHNTIFVPSFHNEEKYEWFPFAKETLKFMSDRGDICLILWTSSHSESIEKYIDVMSKEGITFDYVNENPEVENDDLCSFDKKLYFNVGIDDKFGFDASNDWLKIMEALKAHI